MSYRAPLLVLACLAVLGGCILTERYSTRDKVRMPDGTQEEREVIHPSPLSQGVTAAAPAAMTGNWPYALAAGGTALVTALLAAWDSRKNRQAATEAAQLAQELRPLAERGDPAAAQRALQLAGWRQQDLGVRARLRRLRPPDAPQDSQGGS